MTIRTALFARNQPGGVFTIEDVPDHPGSVFFVDSTHATATDAAGGGRSPDKPLATVDYAVGLCTANKGDVIYVMPGHAETINTAAAINLDIAGISVIGLGNGEDRPTITVGSSLDTATVVVGAADVRVQNLVLVPGNDGVDILLDINADGAVVEDCELRSDETNAYQADTYIDVDGGANGADRCTIRRCKITSITAGAAQAINVGAVEDALVIEDNWIDGDFTAAGILSGSIFTNALIRRNVVSNRAAGVHAIEFTAACTGLLVDNRMYSSTLGTILDPGSLKCLGNLETDAVDQAGVDSPRVAAGGFPDNSITADSIAVGAIAADAFAAGAIDAAAIAVGAIAADAFAAGAIDAAAIANSAIDAATFAAGAIDAAAIANSAIDAATFAAGAIDAAAVADGAIDRATFAADTGLQTIRSNTAQAGAAGTVTLDASASASDDYYNHAVIFLTGGTGVGQARLITDYVGATKVASVSPNWVTNPDNTSTFAVLALARVAVGAMVDGTIAAATFAAGAIDAAAIANGAIDAATFAAGAIDAAAIGVGAIAADAFAAGAIDAAAIGVGAIAADAFAAGAIDAAAIATNAIDADAMADGAITAATFAAGAVDATAIADNALDAGAFALSAGEKTTDGVVVTKATAAVPQATNAAIFTVTGLVLLKRIVGYVTTVIGAVANATKLTSVSTGAGANTDLCGTVELNAAAVDSRLEITGVFANAMVKTVDVALALTQTVNIVIPPGTINLDCAGSDGGTGRIRWSATYVPLEAGAQIVAA